MITTFNVQSRPKERPPCDDSFFSGFAAAELKLDRAVDLRAVQLRPAAAAAKT